MPTLWAMNCNHEVFNKQVIKISLSLNIPLKHTFHVQHDPHTSSLQPYHATVNWQLPIVLSSWQWIRHTIWDRIPTSAYRNFASVLIVLILLLATKSTWSYVSILHRCVHKLSTTAIVCVVSCVVRKEHTVHLPVQSCWQNVIAGQWSSP